MAKENPDTDPFAPLCPIFCVVPMQGAPNNIRVNAVAPGHVATPMYGGMPDEALVELTKTDQLMGRPLQPEEVHMQDGSLLTVRMIVSSGQSNVIRDSRGFSRVLVVFRTAVSEKYLNAVSRGVARVRCRFFVRGSRNVSIFVSSLDIVGRFGYLER